MSVAKKQTEARTLRSKPACFARQSMIFNPRSHYPPGTPVIVDQLDEPGRLYCFELFTYQVTTKTHPSRRNPAVAIRQTAQEIYSQRSVLFAPTVSGSHARHITEQNHLVICFDRFLDLSRPGF